MIVIYFKFLIYENEQPVIFYNKIKKPPENNRLISLLITLTSLFFSASY